jgi:hypothetical protein
MIILNATLQPDGGVTINELISPTEIKITQFDPDDETYSVAWEMQRLLGNKGAYLDDGIVIFYPPKPNDTLCYDYPTRSWVDPKTTDWFLEQEITNLREWRTTAQCSPSQGILALGESAWENVLDFGKSAGFGIIQTLNDTRNWRRLSERVQLIEWILSMNADELDAIFTKASKILD